MALVTQINSLLAIISKLITGFLFDCRLWWCSLMSRVLSSAAVVLTAWWSWRAQMVNALKWLSLNDCMESCSVLLITIASMSDLEQAMLIFMILLIAVRSYPAIVLCVRVQWHIIFLSKLKAMQAIEEVSFPEKAQNCFCFECLLLLWKTLD